MAKKRKTIIIVDDNNANLVSCKNILKAYYEVFPAPSAAKMFDLLDHVEPDLILLDVEMPDINGYEAAKMLKDGDEFKGIPIIFLTAKSDATSEMEGLNLGALDYIHKPFVSTLLLRRIELHLSLIEYQKSLEERKNSIEKLLELKTIEVMQRKAAEAEAQKALSAKDELLSRMSEEIVTPLGDIIGILTAAKDTNDPKRISECLEKVNSKSSRLLAIVNDMLDISKK